VADREYARPHIGASITGSNSGSGALPTREPKQVENKDNAANDRARTPHGRMFCRSHDAVIRVYDEASNVIETYEQAGDFKEP